MRLARHILVASDFSEASKGAVETARDYARTLGAQLTLLHVYAPQIDPLAPANLAESLRIGHEVHEALAALKDRARGVEHLHTDVVAARDVPGTICDYAQTHGADLIVVGSHGLTGIKRMLIGSVAERVARHASCAVLIVRG